MATQIITQAPDPNSPLSKPLPPNQEPASNDHPTPADQTGLITQVTKSDEQKTIITTRPVKGKKSFFSKFFCCFCFPKVLPGKENTSPHVILPKSSSHIVTIDEIEISKEREDYLLEKPSKDCEGKKCLVIDLDETLVHSSFAPVSNADFIVPVDIDGTIHQVYVLKRPYVDLFLESVGKIFECVLFTASLAKYADPVTDLLDKKRLMKYRLFRESCVFYKGSYVKDLSRLGRPMENTIILDNSPTSYLFQPQNAVPIASWFDDPSDTKLLEIINFFTKLSKVPNAVAYLKNNSNELEKLNEALNKVAIETNNQSDLYPNQGLIINKENTEVIASVTSPTR